MRHLSYLLLLASSTGFATACGGDDANGDTSVNVTWAFNSGDCTSNNVTTMRVTWSKQGETANALEFACEDGGGALGNFASSGAYGIAAEGISADGVVRSVSNSTSVTVSGSGNSSTSVELHLHPAPADVTVTWVHLDGMTCPGSVILPYYITLYKAPAKVGGELTEEVDEVQESCRTGQATLTYIEPGNYVIKLDSQAVTPAVTATKEVTVVAGENVQIDLQL